MCNSLPDDEAMLIVKRRAASQEIKDLEAKGSILKYGIGAYIENRHDINISIIIVTLEELQKIWDRKSELEQIVGHRPIQ